MKFKKIYIEITNICNLNCSFCTKDKRLLKEMTIEDFEIIIKKIDLYTDYIYLHVKGEPLLHSKLDQIIKIANKYHKKINITTNGILLKEKLDIIKNNSIRQINISLHSENNKHNYLDEILDVIDKLSNNVYISLRLWILKNKKLDKKSTNIVNKIIKYYNLSPETVDKILKEDNVKIKSNIYLNKDNEFKWPLLNNEYYNDNGYCMGLNSHIAILVDGTVIPCCLASNKEIILGNIFKEDLDEILNKSRTKNMILNFKNRKCSEELCKHCSYKERFNK